MSVFLCGAGSVGPQGLRGEVGLPGVKGKLGEEQGVKGLCGDLSFKREVGVQGSERADGHDPQATKCMKGEVKPRWTGNCHQSQAMTLPGHPHMNFPTKVSVSLAGDKGLMGPPGTKGILFPPPLTLLPGTQTKPVHRIQEHI